MVTKVNSRRRTTERLWLALRLPDLPVQALGMAIDATEPLIIAEKRRLIWINSAAKAAGITLAMDATTAQLLSGCVLQERDRSKEQQRLAQLAEVMYLFSPYIDIYTNDIYSNGVDSNAQVPQSGLLVEISSCLLLFG